MDVSLSFLSPTLPPSPPFEVEREGPLSPSSYPAPESVAVITHVMPWALLAHPACITVLPIGWGGAHSGPRPQEMGLFDAVAPVSVYHGGADGAGELGIR